MEVSLRFKVFHQSNRKSAVLSYVYMVCSFILFYGNMQDVASNAVGVWEISGAMVSNVMRMCVDSSRMQEKLRSQMFV